MSRTSDKLPVRRMRKNAARIVELADQFGHLPINKAGQEVEALLNLSIPCARLIQADIIIGVRDSFDSVNDQAVDDVTRYCRQAVTYADETHGSGWWTDKGRELHIWE